MRWPRLILIRIYRRLAHYSYTRDAPMNTRNGWIQQTEVILVQAYEFKRGFKKNARQRVIDALKECFSTDVTPLDDEYVLSYGALKMMTVRIDDQLLVDTESRSDVSDEVIADTNRRFRDFLERATGYTAKQRAKKAQDAAKRSD